VAASSSIALRPYFDFFDSTVLVYTADRRITTESSERTERTVSQEKRSERSTNGAPALLRAPFLL